jgi:hypothetical protein
MKDRFDELLPWYANGTLGAQDRDWVERYLALHPDSQSELAWHQSLIAKICDSQPAVPETIGLDKVMSLIHADRPTLSQRISGFLSTLGLRPGAAFAAAAVIAVQGAVILNLLSASKDDAAELRTAKATETNDRPMLKLNFAPDAKESEIRLLLMSVQGRLAGGPGQLGDYYVVVPSGKEAALAEKLKTNPIVQAVSLAPGLPPRE